MRKILFRLKWNIFLEDAYRYLTNYVIDEDYYQVDITIHRTSILDKVFSLLAIINKVEENEIYMEYHKYTKDNNFNGCGKLNVMSNNEYKKFMKNFEVHIKVNITWAKDKGGK